MARRRACRRRSARGVFGKVEARSAATSLGVRDSNNMIRCGGQRIGFEPSALLAVENFEVVEQVPVGGDIGRGNGERHGRSGRLLERLELRGGARRAIVEPHGSRVFWRWNAKREG